MAWNEDDRQAFISMLTEYWPQKQPDKMVGLLSLYVKELERFPIAAVLNALRDLKIVEDYPRLPSIKRVKEHSEHSANRIGMSPGRSTRQEICDKLNEISINGTAYWRSPTNKLCRVRAVCIEVLDEERKVSGAIPYADIKTEDLKRILAEHSIETVGEWVKVVEE